MKQCSIRRHATRLAPAALALLLPGCKNGVLDPAGPIGDANALILYDSLAIMLLVVVPTIVAAVWVAWWFRAGNGRARYIPNFVYSGRLEILIWSIPLLVILFLGGIIWFGSHELDPYRRLPGEQQTEVQVVSLDWKWLFIYPQEGVASVNELVVPAGKPLHFTLTSASVMNAFFVPRLGSMIYTMSGMATQLSLKADKPGDYAGLSTMFSGDGFADMHFTLRAVSDQDFAAWVNTAKQGGPTLDRDTYGQLAKQSQNVPPATYRAVDPVLFDAIVRQMVPPGPGPTEGEGARVDVREQGGGHR